MAETINGLYRGEVIHGRRPWRSFEAVECATLEWVDWFDHRRLLESIGNIPPAEAEKSMLCCCGQHRYGSMTHNPPPPTNPGRFISRLAFCLDMKARQLENRATQPA